MELRPSLGMGVLTWAPSKPSPNMHRPEVNSLGTGLTGWTESPGEWVHFGKYLMIR